MCVRRRNLILPCLSCLLAAGGLVSPALGQTFGTQTILGRYQLSVWTDQHGLPQNNVICITQTRAGYLWVGTLGGGAARFDGVNFTIFNRTNTPALRSNDVNALLEDRAGQLWMGTAGGGLTRFADGRFTNFSTSDGLSNEHVNALFEDRGGTLWVATIGGLHSFSAERFQLHRIPGETANNRIWALTEDNEGAIWAGTSRGLARYKDGQFKIYTMDDGLPAQYVRSLCWDREGNLWIGTDGGGVCRFKDGRFTHYGKAEGLTHTNIWRVYRDRAENIWAASLGGGLFRWREGRFTAVTKRDGLPGDTIRAVYQDANDSLWLGASGGLCQFSESRFRFYDERDGLPDDHAMAVYEDRTTNLWIGTEEGLVRIKDEKMTVFTPKDGLPSKGVIAISEDAAGNLWFGTRLGLSRFSQQHFTNWLPQDHSFGDAVWAVQAAADGNIWFCTTLGLHCLRHGRITHYTTRDGLPDNNVESLFADAAGNLWIGTFGGLSRFKDGRFTNFKTKGASIPSFYQDRHGSLWFGTDAGLHRLKDGRLAVITMKDGLFDDLALQILSDTDDDSGNLWMSCARGIYRASLKELNEFAEGRRSSVTSYAYGAGDGMLSSVCADGKPAGWKTRDGRLWFPTLRGVFVMQPQLRDGGAPRVLLEQVTIDRQPLPANAEVVMQPGQENLEIRYTGLSWQRSAQIRFRYQMVGLDRDWTEAGTRRTAYYSHIPPGAYTFKVIAANSDGVWNNEGRSLRIQVLPPFYRTWWFLTLVNLGIAGTAVLAWRYRVAQLEQRQAAQQTFARQLIESQEAERKRIAAELHDSLSQSLVIIKNRALMALQAPVNLERATAQLEEIAESSVSAIDEVKEIAYALRPFHLDRLGLTKAMAEMVEKMTEAHGIQATIDLTSLDGLWSPEVEINLYRIVQESLNNIVRHARANACRVTARRAGRTIELEIADNGRGFAIADFGTRNAESNATVNPQSAIRNPKSGGFGLLGMAERARLLGGQWLIQSAPGAGTTITIKLSVPDKDTPLTGKHTDES